MIDIRKEKVLSALVIGLEFEFFHDRSRKEVARELAKELRKKIEVGAMYHTEDMVVTKDLFKIEPDFSGGAKMSELITGPMEYHEAMIILNRTLSWIRQNGWTDERCALHINLSFDRSKVELKDRFEAINRLKFVLGFDEQYIYERFPKRKNSIYARSINSIFPVNKFVFADEVVNVHTENYELPGDKYYGVNFSKLAKGYMEVRYAGGRSYERKAHEIAEVIEYVGGFTYDVLQGNYSYTEIEIAKLRDAMREYKKVVSSFSDLGMFLANYPRIRLTVDLRADEQVLKTFYPRMRDKIFDLIIRCHMRTGFINYDADVGKYQLKDAVIFRAFPLYNMEVFDSKITGNIVDCDLYRCTITNAHILGCRMFNGNEVSKSKIVDTPISNGNVVNDCYIDAKAHVIEGEINGGIIRSGEVGKNARVSDDTEIVTQSADGKGGKDGFGMGKDGFGLGKDGGIGKDGYGKGLPPPTVYKDGRGKDMPKTSAGFSWKKDVIQR